MASIYNASPITSCAGWIKAIGRRSVVHSTSATGYQQTIELVLQVYQQAPFDSELPHFQRVFDGRIADTPETEIRGNGYVVHILEASL